MEPLTVAGIVTIVLTGALAKVGENALDGSLKYLGQLLEQKAPKTWNKLTASQNNAEALPEIIEVMAETIKDDDEIKKVAEEIAEDNKSKSEVINIMTKVGYVIQGGTFINPSFSTEIK
jgi:predicted Holliday junction resolvase-like endonuclease